MVSWLSRLAYATCSNFSMALSYWPNEAAKVATLRRQLFARLNIGIKLVQIFDYI